MTELNLKNVSTGTWYLLHLACSNVKTHKDRKAVLFLIKTLKHKFICGTCRQHFKDFIDKNPPEDYEDLLYWSWLAHDNANRIANCKRISYNDFKKLY